MLYVAAAIGGIGAGAVYGTCIGNALKWFPDRRGLAAGLTAAGFGAGSALTIIPIQNMIAGSGYEPTFPMLTRGFCRACNRALSPGAKKLIPLTVLPSTSRGLVRRPSARTPAEKSSSADRWAI